MTKKIVTLAIAAIMAQTSLISCGLNVGQGDRRDRNIGVATLNYLDSIPDVEYMGLSDTHDLEDGKFQAVVIFNITDASGYKTERNARVTTNGDGTEILSWEDLDSRVLSETKQKITDKMEEKGINFVDGSLIDALIEIKKQTR